MYDQYHMFVPDHKYHPQPFPGMQGRYLPDHDIVSQNLHSIHNSVLNFYRICGFLFFFQRSEFHYTKQNNTANTETEKQKNNAKQNKWRNTPTFRKSEKMQAQSLGLVWKVVKHNKGIRGHYQ